MKQILRNISIALLCGALAVPVGLAQGRHENNGGGRSRTERTVNRDRGNRGNHNSGGSHSNRRPSFGNSGNNSGHKRPEGVSNQRPNFGNGSNNNRPNRPNVGNGNNNHKPDRPNFGNGNNNHKPDRPNIGNGNNNHRPNRPGVGNNNHRPNRPGFGDNHRKPNRPNFGNNHRPGYRPGHGGPRPPMIAPPHRPYRPVMHRPHYRPMPPRGWRPLRPLPVIRGILGLTFGTAINLSLDYLINAGYTVDGYTNDIVYLRNVSALNYIWTDAALYYGNSGLDASSFYYSTPGYDLARYNNVYNALVATYGAPVSINNTVNSIGATWFGGNNGYITLSFGANNMSSGLRYLTTLTFGL